MPEEDELVRRLVREYGENVVWRQVSQILIRSGYDRTDRQCRERWNNYLKNPPVAVRKWTEREDKLLLLGVEKFGTDFASIKRVVHELSHRGLADLKNRYWHGIVPRTKRTGDSLILSDIVRGRPRRKEVPEAVADWDVATLWQDRPAAPAVPVEVVAEPTTPVPEVTRYMEPKFPRNSQGR
jgi:hypothetical protein